MKALERIGFEKVRQTGSHMRMVRGSRKVTVPAHGTIAPGTLKSILRQAQVELQVLLDVLK